jgi:hypothetical protein
MPGTEAQVQPGFDCGELPSVIAFFLVTATMNIALGYGLAVYLGHGRGWRGLFAGVSPAAIHDSLSMAQDQHIPSPELIAPVAAAISTPPGNATAESLTASAADLAVDAPLADDDATKLESDVLAGIEEFRNQLAQMKAQPAEMEAAPAKAPALARV